MTRGRPGTGDAELRASYVACRRLHSVHGRTYYLASLLLPAADRPAVHALYGFARYADEIVDNLDSGLSTQERADALLSWGRRFLADLDAGASTDPIGRAVVDTVLRYGIPRRLFADFLDSMAMDLTVGSYPTFADLERYMWGSASVIGLQMLPILGPVVPYDVAAGPAAALGKAFQLTNFLRDVGEDLRRDRVYLPLADLAEFGVEVDRLRAGVVDDRFRALMDFEIARAHELYAEAWPGIAMVRPRSRDCLRVAFRLYRSILDEIVRAEYRVLDRRISVPRVRRLAVAGPALVRSGLSFARPVRSSGWPVAEGRRPAGR